MAQATMVRLITNSPYEEPVRHWWYDRETRLFDLEDGCRLRGGERRGWPGERTGEG